MSNSSAVTNRQRPGPSKPMELAPGVRLGRFRLEKHLGTGGQGQVWLASKVDLKNGVGKTVVLKLIRAGAEGGSSENSPSGHRRFLDEARSHAALPAHPNIVQVFDLHTVSVPGPQGTEEISFIEMAHVPGRTLKEVFRDRGNHFSPEHAVYVGLGLCCGLKEVHRAAKPDGTHLGLVHRDINPNNVIISDFGQVVLIDFGMVRAHEREAKTQEHSFVGTARYFAPEAILKASSVDGRSDVFQVGLVMYLMLSRMKHPYLEDGENEAGHIRKMIDKPAKPLRAFNPKVPKALADLIHRMIGLEPDKRPTAVEAFSGLLALAPTLEMYDGEPWNERAAWASMRDIEWTEELHVSSVMVLNSAEMEALQRRHSAPQSDVDVAASEALPSMKMEVERPRWRLPAALAAAVVAVAVVAGVGWTRAEEAAVAPGAVPATPAPSKAPVSRAAVAAAAGVSPRGGRTAAKVGEPPESAQGSKGPTPAAGTSDVPKPPKSVATPQLSPVSRDKGDGGRKKARKRRARSKARSEAPVSPEELKETPAGFLWLVVRPYGPLQVQRLDKNGRAVGKVRTVESPKRGLEVEAGRYLIQAGVGEGKLMYETTVRVLAGRTTKVVYDSAAGRWSVNVLAGGKK